MSALTRRVLAIALSFGTTVYLIGHENLLIFCMAFFVTAELIITADFEKK